MRRSRRAPLLTARLPRAALFFAGVAAVAAVCFAAVTGSSRDVCAIVFITAGCASALAHCAVTRSRSSAAGLLVVTAGLGLASEAASDRTGWPFGRLAYTSTLGYRVLDVPLVAALGWTMLAWLAFVVASRLTSSARGAVLLGAWTLTALHLLVDPQVTAAGHLTWKTDRLLFDGVPALGYLGVLAISLLMMLTLWVVIPRPSTRRPDDRVVSALFLGGFLAVELSALFVYDLPSTALVGAAGVGVVAVPYAATIAGFRLR